MMKPPNEKHKQSFPTVRKIKRSCNRELYRTIKKLNIWLTPEKISAAEQLYFKKVVLNIQFISENGSNRKILADWWEENVCPEIAALWDVEPSTLARAFRDSFGG